MNLKDHYQALYDEMRAALDGDGYTTVPILHVFAGDSQTGEGYAPPYVIYTQDVERSYGTTGGGASKVLRSSWRVTVYAVGLAEGLNVISSIADGLADSEPQTADGYFTTHLWVSGVQSMYDHVAKVYGVHLRLDWERSA